MARKVTRGQAVKRADMWFSRWVRKSAANAKGQARCFTCGKTGDWKHEMQAGHFQTRSKYSIRWSETNVKCQCPRCNITNGGQQYTFGLRLNEVHGPGTAEDMVQKGNQLRKYSTAEILEIAETYKNKFNEL